MRNLLLNWQGIKNGGNSMKNEKSTPETRALNSEKSTLKDSDYFDNNQFINELNRKIKELEATEAKSVKVKRVKKLSLFDVVTAVGLAVLIFHLILKF